ncbi:MAG: pyridoxamine 5'-phosphate oxidase family protein [Solirubrobacteraceae bacterium]
MTATLPPEVREVFERFITTEYVTVDAKGQPIAWPVTPYHHAEQGCIDVTTGIGYPKKADDAARNPHVALLFSEPTGSGLSGAPMVLVQGTAHVDETDLDGNRRRYVAEAKAKLPEAMKFTPPQFVQKMAGWYFDRIYVHVRPERVFVWPGGDAAQDPEMYLAHVEEVRSGHDELPDEPRAAPEGGSTAWDERIDAIGSRTFPTAVVSVVGPDGFPFAARLPVRPDRDAGVLRVEGECAGAPWAAGLACVTVHDHDASFTYQRNFQVRGDLVQDAGAWVVVPHKLVGGFELPPGSMRAKFKVNADKIKRFRKIAKERKAA